MFLIFTKNTLNVTISLEDKYKLTKSSDEKGW